MSHGSRPELAEHSGPGVGRSLPRQENLADFAPQFLDIHILSNDHIAVRVDDVEALDVREPA
jgi:hypothetical protein